MIIVDRSCKWISGTPPKNSVDLKLFQSEKLATSMYLQTVDGYQGNHTYKFIWSS